MLAEGQRLVKRRFHPLPLWIGGPAARQEGDGATLG